MIRFIDKPIFGLVLALAASCLGCSEDEPTASEPTQASTVVNPAEGNEAQGTVESTQETGGVRFVANLTGLTEGDHGFHIHEKGDCSAADGTSAGGRQIRAKTHLRATSSSSKTRRTMAYFLN